MIRATCPHCTVDRDLVLSADEAGKVTGICAVHDIVLEGTLGYPPLAVERRPYVSHGIDGALRSATIDREEADTLAPGDPRRDELLDSARRWDQQARRLGYDGDDQRPARARRTSLASAIGDVLAACADDGTREIVIRTHPTSGTVLEIRDLLEHDQRTTGMALDPHALVDHLLGDELLATALRMLAHGHDR
jgi:hypothetical protein